MDLRNTQKVLTVLFPTEANSTIADLKEELASKSRDLEVIRECLVDLRGQVN